MKTASTLHILLPSLLLAACSNNLEPYYSGAAPSISGLSVDGQVGTLPGQTVIIDGSNFGGDPRAVTVVFGNLNAEIITASEDTLTVTVPHGPVSGGPVAVSVGTAGGRDRLEGAYTYERPDRAENQIAYITIANNGTSCLSGRFNDTLPDNVGCDFIAFTGDTGIYSRAEGFDFLFPDAHIPFSLGDSGFAQANSLSWEEWAVIPQPFALNSFDLENDTENQRLGLGKITLTNPLLEGETACVDLGTFASYTYNGGDELSSSVEDGYLVNNTSVGGTTVDLSEGLDCDSEEYETKLGKGLAREDDLSVLELCETDEYETSNTYVYQSDWLANESFFQIPTEDGPDHFSPIDVTLDMPKAGIENVSITLTEAAQFLDATEDEEWVLRLNKIDNDTCVDDDDADRTTNGGDALYTWQWEPSAIEHDLDEDEGPVKSVNTYVVANLTYLSLSWLGGEGAQVLATIAVDDFHNYDEDTGLSSLSVPAWVLYSMPSANLDFGSNSSGWGGWGSATGMNYGYIFVTVDRITEYTLAADNITTPNGETVSGDIVLAYSTGELTYSFFDNPLETDSTCTDCIDNDGDGWTDGDDPDCFVNGGEETNASSDFTCNDGVDNDGDGDIDWEDADCPDGGDGEIDDCSNGIDDDDDGWIDADDPDCVDGIIEGDLTSAFTCNDGIDNDFDGWIDVDDLACSQGIDSEDDGTTGTACNDSIDNDGHGDIDADDVLCAISGAAYDAEEELSGECADKKDNDSDGYTDGYDPDCDIGTTEVNTSTVDAPDSYGGLELPCYNAVDDDGDGVIDAEDPGCENGDVPDGFFLDEAAADPAKSECLDKDDNDGDGWIDDADPDCAIGDTEVGLSGSACNDGKDNDADTLVDADDPDCVDGFDVSEN